MSTAELSDLGQWALTYARAGLPVFPLAGKVPLISTAQGGHGFHDATCDEDKVAAWWSEHPDANIGIAIPDGVTVVDVDPRDDGNLTLAQLVTKYGSLPETRMTLSGRGDGGHHRWHRVNGRDIPASLGRGIQVKCPGKGYVVAPPSIHPVSGRPYVWVDFSQALAPLPEWVYDLASPPSEPAGERQHHSFYDDPSWKSSGGPGDDFNARGNIFPYLTEAGAQILKTDTNGDVYIVRPGKDPREGHSAIWHPSTHHLVVWSTGWKEFPIPDGTVPGQPKKEQAGFDAFGVFGRLRHTQPDGTVDWIAAAAELRGLGYGKQSQAAEDSENDDDPEAKETLPAPANPMAVARELLGDRVHQPSGEMKLRHWRGQWMAWTGAAWVEVDERAVKATAYQRVEHAVYDQETASGMKKKLWAPNRHKLADLLDAYRAVTHLDAVWQPPVWLDSSAGTAGIVACANGLLDVGTRKLSAHTPLFFNEISVPFDYEADTLEPTGWLEFLDQLWGDDTESIGLLQQWYGYVLSGQTNLQKILGIIGPIRSGKGTICRVLKGLVGARNVTAPTLSSFGQNFGLQDLIGKSVAIIGDVRLGGAEQHAVVERLLSISGEDNITLDRKYRDPWTGQLPTRIMFVSNELPRFGDASGAIATRCLVLETRKSFLGEEDRSLTQRLLGELPGILNWTLDGLEALEAAGRFSEPQSSQDATRVLADLVSPVSAFVRDLCLRGPLAEVACADLYGRWRLWAEDNSQRAGSAQTFGRNLRAVVPGLRVTQPRADDARYRVYQGVGLKKGAGE